MIKPVSTTDSPISDKNLARVMKATMARDAIEPRVQQVRYGAAGGTLELQLRDATMVRTPARAFSALANATAGQLADVKIVSNGAALH